MLVFHRVGILVPSPADPWRWIDHRSLPQVRIYLRPQEGGNAAEVAAFQV